MNVATLRGDVLLRQPIPDEDGPVLDGWFANDPDGAWLAFLERPSSDQRAVLDAAIKGQEHHYWIIEVGRQVGLVRLSTKKRPAGDVALLYYVPREHRNRRYATHAGESVVRHAFEDLDFRAIVADVLLSNEPSAKVLKKIGFERTGNRTLAKTDRGQSSWRSGDWRDGPPASTECAFSTYVDQTTGLVQYTRGVPSFCGKSRLLRGEASVTSFYL